MGSITGYTRRTANIGSAAGGGAAIKTIYTDNDTIDNQVREVSLYGNTSSDKLIFQNLAGNDLLTLYGDKSIDLGSAAMAIENERHYFGASSGACTFYRNSATYLTIDPANYNTTFLGTASQGIAILSNQGQIYAVGPTASFASYNIAGNKKADIGITGNGGFLSLFNSAGTYIFAIDANSAVAGIIGDFGIGAFGPYSARLDVKGIGTASGLTA